MSQSNNSQMDVGCPECNATVNTSIPLGTRAEEFEWDDPNRLQGKEAQCRSCGHELEVYYY